MHRTESSLSEEVGALFSHSVEKYPLLTEQARWVLKWLLS